MFKDRGFQIPGVFSCFTGYNTPEASKHRKRQVGNMSGVEAECGMCYSPNKLKAEDKRQLERKLDNFAFSCGTTLEELDLPEHMQNLAVRQLQSEEPVEKLYYSMGYEPICIYCSSEDNLDIPNDSFILFVSFEKV